jgi:hypothetical protein
LGDHRAVVDAICRRARRCVPDAFVPDLAASLNNHSDRLAALGRWETR